MRDRPTIDVPTPAGGWGQPWPNVAEIERVFSHERWTLVGGLMVQLHCVHAGFSPVRPTNDVDMVLHIETERALPAAAARALESLGYELALSIDQCRELKVLTNSLPARHAEQKCPFRPPFEYDTPRVTG